LIKKETDRQNIFKEILNALKKMFGVFDLKIYYNNIVYIMAPKNSKTPVPVVESKPVAESKSVAESKPAPQKGGKKAAPASTPTVVAAPVATPVATPVAEQKGGKKVAAPKVAAPVATPVAGKSKAKKAAVPETPKVQKAAGTKKAAAPKTPKAPKAPKEEVIEDAEGELDPKGVRSFKVQLPGTEEYSGRFTGLTPYQAANKALSKFFRENKDTTSEISFSIRESTRGSKRSTYTYNGKREKLDVPVKYSIKSPSGEAREIVKEYKNKLTKVKKTDTVAA
jgi:hypothetical protein